MKLVKDQSVDFLNVCIVRQHSGAERECCGRDPNVVLGDRSPLAFERDPDARVFAGYLLGSSLPATRIDLLAVFDSVFHHTRILLGQFPRNVSEPAPSFRLLGVQVLYERFDLTELVKR